ncbi:hypothetical protein [Borrelia duttonii]
MKREEIKGIKGKEELGKNEYREKRRGESKSKSSDINGDDDGDDDRM